MRKIIFIALISALLAAIPEAARADYREGEMVPATVIAPLMAWVQKETGVRVPALPRVEANRTKLLRIAAHLTSERGHARALYTGGAIVLDHYMFDAEDSTQLSFLVHELVHYAQSFRTTPVGSCSKAKEFEAYTLQNKWLQEQGHAPIVTASWIDRMAACPAPTTVALAQIQ